MVYLRRAVVLAVVLVVSIWNYTRVVPERQVQV
jgi:hypothetical protein